MWEAPLPQSLQKGGAGGDRYVLPLFAAEYG